MLYLEETAAGIPQVSQTADTKSGSFLPPPDHSDRKPLKSVPLDQSDPLQPDPLSTTEPVAVAPHFSHESVQVQRSITPIAPPIAVESAILAEDRHGHTLRAIQRDGDPWFVAKDVCDVLGLDVSDTRKTLDEDERALAKAGQYPGLPNRGATIISESGFYALVLKSRKPQARAFRKWVTSVVLPAIRRDGSYVMGEEKVQSPEELEALLAAACERKRARIAGAESTPGPTARSSPQVWPTRSSRPLRWMPRRKAASPLSRTRRAAQLAWSQ